MNKILSNYPNEKKELFFKFKDIIYNSKPKCRKIMQTQIANFIEKLCKHK